MNEATTPHIVRAFDKDIMGVVAKLVEMGAIAEEMLSDALTSLEKQDTALAEAVIARDKQLDALEYDTADAIIRVMALRQPVAQDLRLLVACLKLSATLERVGDLAKNTAKRGRNMQGQVPSALTSSVVRLGKMVQGRLAEAIDSFTANDTDAAMSIWQRDLEIDEFHSSIFRELTTYMLEDPRLIAMGSSYMFLVKNLERIGDHATHVAEMTWYVVKGEQLTEDRPKISSSEQSPS